jgi:hypothetical protein
MDKKKLSAYYIHLVISMKTLSKCTQKVGIDTLSTLDKFLYPFKVYTIALLLSGKILYKVIST